MKTKNQIKLELTKAQELRNLISKKSTGSMGWREMNGYIDALELVLEVDS